MPSYAAQICGTADARELRSIVAKDHSRTLSATSDGPVSGDYDHAAKEMMGCQYTLYIFCDTARSSV